MKRNIFKLIAKLLNLVGSFIFVLILAIFNGVLGNLLAINITFFAALAILKHLGIEIILSYQLIYTIIILSGVFRGLVRYVEQYFNHYIAFKILAIIRMKVFKALQKLNISTLDNKNKGDLTSMILSDVETLEVFYAHTITLLFIALIIIITITTTLGNLVNWYFALIALISYLIIGFIIPVIFYRQNKKIGVEYRKKLGSFNDYYLSSIYGNYEIISNQKIEERKSLLKNKSDELIKLNNQLENKNVRFKNVVNLLIGLSNIIIILVGGVLILNHKMDGPLLILGYVTLTSSFGSIVALANLPNNLTMSFASGNRIIDLMEEKNPIITTNKINAFAFENLKIENLSFKYDNKLVLDNITMEVNKNDIVGILGKSGSGKSTILKLLMHYYDGDGEIKFNDYRIQDISFNALYSNVNIFSQQTYLFKGTIRENIMMGNPNASEEELIKACKDASIYDFISNLNNGFDTQIKDLKDNLSSGERQRIGLARVFLKKPKLLLLDEATSNIDAINEGIILNSLKNLKGTTIIMISHRKSTLSICNKRYLLEGGKLCLLKEKLD